MDGIAVWKVVGDIEEDFIHWGYAYWTYMIRNHVHFAYNWGVFFCGLKISFCV